MVQRDDFTDCDTDIRLDGKVAVVTGATSGLGFEVAKNFARRGAKVIMASRNAVKLAAAKQEIIRDTGNQRVMTHQIDLISLSSVRNFVEEMSTEPRLDILSNNIGATGLQDTLTEDGLQLMMQVNYFGSFLLTFLLFPLMKRSAPSRIVNVSSLALILGDIDFNRWNQVSQYSDYGYYCNAKLADVLFTVEMNRRITGSGVSVYSMDPGLIKSDLFKKYGNKILDSVMRHFGRPPQRAATMPVFLAVDPKIDNKSGKHFRDCKEFYSSWYANDTVLTERLWHETKKLVKITKEEDWENLSVA